MEKILVLDFGGQYDQLIARRVREQNVYAQVRYYDRICLSEGDHLHRRPEKRV